MTSISRFSHWQPRNGPYSSPATFKMNVDALGSEKNQQALQKTFMSMAYQANYILIVSISTVCLILKLHKRYERILEDTL